MTFLRRAALALALPLFVAGCAETVMAPDAEVQRAAYHDDGPPTLTLYTMINNRSGNGDHSALMISGSQRVLFDPFGTFHFPTVPEQADVLYGFTPRIRSVYIDFHARETYRVLEQEITVSPEVAEMALRLAQQNGAVGPARCTKATSGVVRRLPGFEDAPSTFFPSKLAEYFATRPGVRERTIRDDDADDNHGVIIREASDLPEGATAY